MLRKTAATVALSLVLVACVASPPPDPGPGSDLVPAPPRPAEVSSPEVDGYLAGLRYDPRQILAERVGDTSLPARRLPDETQDDGHAIVIVKQVKHRLEGNIDDIVILSPTHSVVWPGALLRGDDDLVRGTPTPLPGRRAPMWLSVDLPGIGGHGVFAVDQPSHGAVQAAVDQALDWWNDHQYREGYVSKSRSKYVATMVYSAEQLAASLGLNYWSLKGDLSAQFQATTTRSSKVAMALFKQVFYTVSFEAPSRPGAVFHPEVTLDEIRAAATAAAPPVYVSSVDYGRLLLLRLETDAETSHTAIEGALRYLGGTVTAAADHQRTLQRSKVTLITIGGNAEVNARAVDATRIQDLHEVIQGKNALYSKNNPGEPIAYTLRFLKDRRLAKIGFTTDYTELVCERHPHGWIGFKHSGAYVAKFYLNWTEGGEKKSWSSGKKTAGFSETVRLKGNARDIRIHAQAMTGLAWDPWGTIFKLSLTGPPNKFYVAKGTTLKRKWETADR
ncbi:MAG: thiol-activated cytolysin family protein [Planctomycetes bacterium]|nr:thiol-activated cytolysin family protein [Planctomycetota bacterium]